MGLLDSVIGAIGSQAGGAGGGGQADILNAIVGMLGQPSGGGQGGGLGGLAGLVQAFQQSGLGHVADSWVGTGANHPVSADQLTQVLGSERVAGFAKQLGIDPQDALGHLTQMLPQVVDKLTPNGQIPQGDLGGLGNLGGLGGLLGGLLGGGSR